MDFRELFLKQKDAIRRRTREVMSGIRPEHLGFHPEKDALTVHEMLRHLWKSEEGVRAVAMDGNFAYYETRIPKGLRATLGAFQSLPEELENLDRVHEETLARVAQSPAELFEEERARTDLNFRRKVWVILLGINEHEVHHRAQLMTYLRMLGSPVPDATRR